VRNSGYFVGVERKIDPAEFLQKHMGARDSMLGSYDDQSKRRTQYFEEQFQYKDRVNGTIRERVLRDSPVIAELRTNVIVSVSILPDEISKLTDRTDQG
jgi:hypothetical protein